MPRSQSILDSTKKLRELILYIAEQSEGDEAFGATKLNKLLFYSDFTAYLSVGRSITQQEYQKLPNGPAPRQIVPVMDAMRERSELAIAERNYYGHLQKKVFALREPDLTAFSGTEIAVVNNALEHFRHMNASAISEASHAFIGWRSVAEGETIPYATALIDDRELTAQEKLWADELDTTGLEELLVA